MCSLQGGRAFLELGNHLGVADVGQATLGGLELRGKATIQGTDRLCLLQIGTDLRLHAEDLCLCLTEILQDIADALRTLGIGARGTAPRLEGLDEVTKGLEEALWLGCRQGKTLRLAIGRLSLGLHRGHGTAPGAGDVDALPGLVGTGADHPRSRKTPAATGGPTAHGVAQGTTGVGADAHLVLRTLRHKGIAGRALIDHRTGPQGCRARSRAIVATICCHRKGPITTRDIHEDLIPGLRYRKIQ